MCSLPLNQFCTKLLQTTHIQKKVQKFFLQQLGNRKIFLLVTGERNYNSNEHKICISWNKPNETISVSEIWIGTDYFETEWFASTPISTQKANTPNRTQDDKPLLFNTLSALGLLHCGLEITVDNYQQPFFMRFDLTSTKQAAHNFLHPELTNTYRTYGLTANPEVFVWGVRSSNVYITSDRKITKIVLTISTV